MISLNKSHPDFCMRQEVACMIPKLPVVVEMESICDDLGIDRERLNILLGEIQKNHRVQYQPGAKDMAIGSPRLSWAGLNQAAERYFNTVYGEAYQDVI